MDSVEKRTVKVGQLWSNCLDILADDHFKIEGQPQLLMSHLTGNPMPLWRKRPRWTKPPYIVCPATTTLFTLTLTLQAWVASPCLVSSACFNLMIVLTFRFQFFTVSVPWASLASTSSRRLGHTQTSKLDSPEPSYLVRLLLLKCGKRATKLFSVGLKKYGNFQVFELMRNTAAKVKERDAPALSNAAVTLLEAEGAVKAKL